MNGKTTIFGFGPTGRATTERLIAEGGEVIVAQRHEPAGVPKGARFVVADALDSASTLQAVKGAEQFVVAVGFPYRGSVWREFWPRAMTNFLAAAERTQARMLFLDNLYMYGPQAAPLTETTPLSSFGVKPAVRAAITRQWIEASAAGRARVAALRAPDFYGPGVGLSFLGDVSIGAMARGKAAMVIGSPDIPHDFAYVPDVARAATSLLAAPDDAFGQAWHVPCAPTRTTREVLATAAEALGVPLRIRGLPEWALGPLGVVAPVLRERREMTFIWDRPYRVDASKFKARFWDDATPFEVGVPQTALAFKRAVGGPKD